MPIGKVFFFDFVWDFLLLLNGLGGEEAENRKNSSLKYCLFEREEANGLRFSVHVIWRYETSTYDLSASVTAKLKITQQLPSTGKMERNLPSLFPSAVGKGWTSMGTPGLRNLRKNLALLKTSSGSER